jgi:hypothetical protein
LRGCGRAALFGQRYIQWLLEFRHFAQRARATNPQIVLRWRDRHPCLGDKIAQTAFDRHYIYHTAWAARILASTRPALHIDVGSSLYFVSIVSAFVTVDFYDYRPPDLRLDKLACRPGDLTDLPFPSRSVKSLSCMHVLEHIGLGRYGDPLDPTGDVRAMRELQRVVAPGGDLLIVVPVGKPRICFNAHRIYSHRDVLESFPELQLEQFALVPDYPEEGGLVVAPPASFADRQDYGCGCFWFRRPSPCSL